MYKLLIGGAAAAAVVALTPAFAENMKPHHGMMNKTEARSEVQGHVATMFAKADADKDGFVTTAEMDAMHARRGEHRQEKMASKAASFDPAKAFARLDTNNDGKLSRPEVEAVRAAHKPDSKGAGHAERLFARADTNKDGIVTLAEFQAAPRPHFDKAAMPHHGGGRAHMLAMADLNKDGRVSLAEAQQAALAHFDRADTNKDGKVTPEERRAAFKAMRPS